MANLQNFRFYRNGSANVGTIPRYQIEGQIEGIDPNTGGTIVVQDFTGNNRLTFPGGIAAYTEDQRLGLVEIIARYMINVAAGGALDG